MVPIHELDIRMKCILQVLHHVLVLLLRLSTEKHPDCITKTNLDTGLAQIIRKKESRFRGKKSLNKDHYKKFFFDPTTNVLKNAIVIDRLDFLVMCTILRTPFLTSFRKIFCQQCQQCDHACTTCHPSPCEGTLDCVIKTCGCGCRYEEILRFIFVARALRNTNAHTVYKQYEEFVNDINFVFDDFPSCNDWKDIWEITNKACMDCLDLLHFRGFIDADEMKDQEMNLWIGLRKEQNFLLPIVGTFIKQYRELISGEKDIAVRLASLERSMLDQSKILSMDFVYLNGKLVSFQEAKVKKSFELSSIHSKGVEFTSKFTDTFKEVVLQTKLFGSSWCLQPLESFTVTTENSILRILVSDLDPKSSYCFRFLGVSDNEDLFSFFYNDLNIESLECNNFVCSKGVLITRELNISAYQKTNRGINLLIPMPSIKLITVQFKNHNQSGWTDLRIEQYKLKEKNTDVGTDRFQSNIAVVQTDQCNVEAQNEDVLTEHCALEQNYAELELFGLERKCIDVRCIAEQESIGPGHGKKEIISFQLRKIHIVCQQQLNHVTNKGNILTIIHANGMIDDLHCIVSTIKQSSTTQALSIECQNGGGSTSYNLTEARDYLTTNFQKERIIVFPLVFPDSSDDVSILVKRFQKMFEKTIDRNNRIIIVLDQRTITMMQNNINKSVVEQEDNQDEGNKCKNTAIVIFDGSLNMVLFIGISHSNSLEALYNDHANMHDALTAFVQCSSDAILSDKAEPLALVGVLATVSMDKQQLESIKFCGGNHKLCCSSFLTKDIIEDKGDLNKWYQKLSRNVHEEYSNKEISVDKLSSKIHACANRLMVLRALYDPTLPSAFGSPDTKIRTLLLNKEQMQAVYHPSKKKIITGPYGCGKTIVGQRILENILSTLNPENDHVFYIIFEQYSLLEIETEMFCQKLEDRYKVPITCCNAYDQRCCRRHSVTLSSCLDHLARRPERRTHVFIDEYDIEELTETESRDIVKILKTYFVNSYVILVTRSLMKYRALVDKDIAEYERESNCLDYLGRTMELIALTKIMRYTNTIMEVSEHVRFELEGNANFYYQPALIKNEVTPTTSVHTLNHDETDEAPVRTSISADGNTDLERHYGNLDVDTTDAGIRTPATVSLQNMSLDRVMKHLFNLQRTNFDKDLAIKTEFRFYKNEGCGHKVNGQLPSIVRFEDLTSVENVSMAIAELANPMWKRSLYICGDLRVADLAHAALIALEVDVVEYLDGLEGCPCDAQRKHDAYESWMREKNCVLLTDNSGCRGLQHEQVVILLDENECYERFLLPEMIGRSTSNLVLFTFNNNKSTKQKTKSNNYRTIKNIIEILLEKKSLNQKHVRDLPKLDNLDCSKYCKTLQIRKYPQNYLENCIKAWTKIVGSPVKSTKTSSMPLFLRARGLAKYVVDRNLRRQEAIDNCNGEKLYINCKDLMKRFPEQMNYLVDQILSVKSEKCVIYFTKVMKEFLSPECNMDRLIVVFATCMVLCQKLEKGNLKYLQKDLMEETASIVVQNEDWVMKIDFPDILAESRSLKELLTDGKFASILAAAMGGLAAIMFKAFNS